MTKHHILYREASNRGCNTNLKKSFDCLREAGWEPVHVENRSEWLSLNFSSKNFTHDEKSFLDDLSYDIDEMYSLFNFVKNFEDDKYVQKSFKHITISSSGRYVLNNDFYEYDYDFITYSLTTGDWSENVYLLKNMPLHFLVKFITNRDIVTCFTFLDYEPVAKTILARKDMKTSNYTKKDMIKILKDGVIPVP